MALRGGGPDNVTVVVADVVDYDYGQTQPIIAGAVSGDDDNPDTPPNTSAGRASAFSPRPNIVKRLLPAAEAPAKRPRSRRRIIIAAVLLILVILAALAVGREMIRSNYYVSEHDGTVSIMRGVQGSFLGFSLQEPYLLGCLNDRNELSLISFDQSHDKLDCHLLGVNDLRPSERAQVIAGLPTGSLDNAISQINELARSSLLPVCAPLPPPPGKPAPTSGAAPPFAPSPALTPGAVPSSTPGQVPSSAPPAPESPSPAAGPAPPATTPAPTVTALPPPPPEPGTNCRAAA